MTPMRETDLTRQIQPPTTETDFVPISSVVCLGVRLVLVHVWKLSRDICHIHNCMREGRGSFWAPWQPPGDGRALMQLYIFVVLM